MSTVEVIDAHGPRVEAIWRGLEAQARPPYFLTWGWIENWIACLPREEAPRLHVISAGGAPIGAFFLGQRRVVRHGIVPSRALYLNATGTTRVDELCLEHNAILGAANLDLPGLLDALPGGWDELVLPALSRAEFPGNALDAPLDRYRVCIDRVAAAPFVDLARVRAAGDYFAVLRPGVRAQLRRAQRGFGELNLDVAADEGEAADIYGELVRLHGLRWRARGQAGAFADPWFDRFHRRLIAERFRHGEIQLLRLRAGATTVGCLYNLVAGGRVLFYQSGLESFDDPHLKPGYLCHAAAVRLNAASGHAVYDLLAGASRYKQSLATDEVDLVWARIQRPLRRFAIEERVRAWKRAVIGGRQVPR